jgi:putative FmdB family regulatory protein
MPIYEYRCSSCGHELEALQKFSDAPMRACPSCRGETLVKLMSAAGFQLKGSGWYVTDFKGGGKPAAKSDDGSAKSAEGKSESKSEAKSESKSDSKSESKSETKSDAKTATASTGTGSGTS